MYRPTNQANSTNSTKQTQPLTNEQLTKRLIEAERIIVALLNTVRVLDAGTLVAIYSLIQDDKVKYPEIKSVSDIAKTGVSEVTSKILEILSKAEGSKDTDDSTNREKA